MTTQPHFRFPPPYSHFARQYPYSSDPSAHLISKGGHSNSYFNSSFPSLNATDLSPLSPFESHQSSFYPNLPPINTLQSASVSSRTSSYCSTSSSFLSTGRQSPSRERPGYDSRRSSESLYSDYTPESLLPSSHMFSPSNHQQQQPQPSPINIDHPTFPTTTSSRPRSPSIHNDGMSPSFRHLLNDEEEEEITRKRIKQSEGEGGDGGSDEDYESSSSGYQKSTITPCSSPLHIIPSSETSIPGSLSVSPVGNNSDTGSMLGEQLPQQQVLRQNKGLRHFSKQVCDKVEQKVITTYNEVADELSEDFTAQMQEQGGHKVDQKNIRRRVYDALNVLMAMDIIQKDKKEIRWLGLPGHSQDDTISSSSSVTTSAEIERQKSEIEKLERENRLLSQKIDKGKTKIARHYQIQSIVKRNAQRRNSGMYGKSEGKIRLPFVLLKCPKGTITEIKEAPDGPMNSTILSFSNLPTIVEDTDVLQRLCASPDNTPKWDSPEHLKSFMGKNDGDYRIRRGDCEIMMKGKNVVPDSSIEWGRCGRDRYYGMEE